MGRSENQERIYRFSTGPSQLSRRYVPRTVVVLMRFTFKRGKLFIGIAGIFLFVGSFTNVTPQKGLGSTAPSGSIPSGSKAPVNSSRTRTTKAKPRTPLRSPETTSSDGSESTTTTPTLAPLPVAGSEEKKEGIDAYNQKDYDKAIEKLTAAGKVKEADAEIFYLLGD